MTKFPLASHLVENLTRQFLEKENCEGKTFQGKNFLV